jgi:hypothetical protein
LLIEIVFFLWELVFNFLFPSFICCYLFLFPCHDWIYPWSRLCNFPFLQIQVLCIDVFQPFFIICCVLRILLSQWFCFNRLLLFLTLTKHQHESLRMGYEVLILWMSNYVFFHYWLILQLQLLISVAHYLLMSTLGDSCLWLHFI